MAITERDTLKLHTDPWGLWYARGFDNPTAVEDQASFLNGLYSDPSRRVRLLGTPQNAELITHLYTTELPVEVASPSICTPPERRDAQAVMYRIRTCSLPSSLGGWHRLLPEDQKAYAHMAAWNTHRAFTVEVDNTYRQHPGAKALGFIPSLSIPDAAELLAILVDPRWFIDPDSPYRLARLRGFLGLLPRHVDNLDKEAEPGSTRYRCQLLMRTWQGAGLPRKQDMRKPGNFLWRRYVETGGGTRGLLRAGGAFVTYLARNWHQQMLLSTPRPIEMFIPNSFFQSRELPAYRRHMLSSG